MDKPSADRIHELEMQLAHLGRQHEQLSEVVFERGRTIDSLERLVEKLFKKVGQLEQDASSSGGDHDFSAGEPTEGFEFGLDGEPL